MTKGFRLLFLVFVVNCIGFAWSSGPAAAQVSYVKICSLYGDSFYYIPGTDICLDTTANDARQATTGGLWRWRIPNNPRTWVSKPQDACKGGQLVKFGDLTSSGLTLNSHERYETNTQYRLNLKPGQYIASVLYKGGWTSPKDYPVSDLPDCPSPNAYVTDATDLSCTSGAAPVGGGTKTCEVACVSGAWQFTGSLVRENVGAGNFCMFYFYNDPVHGPVYSFPLGCIDTSSQADVPTTLVFSPDRPIPPADVDEVYVLGANGEPWNVLSTAAIRGGLSVWLCLQ